MADATTPLAELTVLDVTQESFPTVRPDEPCSKVVALFADEEVPAVVVTDDKGRYEGFISERDVLRSNVNLTKTPVAHVLPSHAAPTMAPGDLLVDAAASILDANARGVAVIEKEDHVERVTGMVTREDIIGAAGTRELSEEPVSQYMTQDVQTVDGETTVAKALSLMKREGFSHLPVIEEGRLTGIVTIHDIIRRVLAPLQGDEHGGWKSGDHERPLAIPVSGIMSSPVVSLPRGATYGEAAELIAERGIGSVVITKDGEFPYGIVTRRDLLEPVSLLTQEVPTIVVHFSSKDTSRDGYETTGAPEDIKTFLDRYQERIEPGLLLIHAKKHKDKNRGVDLWHVRLNLTCDMGKFYAVGEGWGMKHATSLAVDRLERDVRRKKEESLEYPSREFIEDLLY